MDVLAAMRLFRRVVELESFTAAARDQRLGKPAASKIVRALEERLRTKLLHRTTRKLSLTADGEAYYAHCVRIVDEIDAAEDALEGKAAAPRGTLRVNAPMSFGLLHVAPLLPALLADHPELSLEISFADRFVDLVEEGVDVVVRVASELEDSATLTAQRLGVARRVICASPAYLRARGTPKTPADLSEHECVVYSGSANAHVWQLSGPDGPIAAPVRGRLVLDNSIAIRDVVMAGAGITLIPSLYVEEQLARGELREVLAGFRAKDLVVHAVYPRSKHLSPKVRAFVEHLRARFAEAPWSIVSSERTVKRRRR